MSVNITETAAQKIASLIQENPTENMFRITVSGGGCKGFQYAFSLDRAAGPEDHVFEEQGVKVVIDEASLPLIEGIQIDYIEELIGASFQIKNPNAATSCGCGNSFSI
jgi:iron-sulfur cluster insertion protein